MKARVSQLHKTESEWLKFNNWKPEAGELIIYDPDEKFKYARIKIGDGQHSLQELDFFIDSAVNHILLENKFTEIIDSGRITEYK